MKKIICVLLLFTVSGCTSIPHQLTASLYSATPREKYEELGRGEGQACALILLDFIPIRFRNMPMRAHRMAVQMLSGDTLINPVLTEKWYWVFVGNLHCTHISGTVIKFVD